MKLKILSIVSLAVLVIASCVPIAEKPIVQSRLEESKETAIPGMQASPTPELRAAPTTEVDQISLERLRNRTYGNGTFTVDRLWHTYERFNRYYIIYDSDDLSIHGYVNVPKGEGPYPVIMMLHGYIPSAEYDTLDYTTRYADALAKEGYIVLHPNMRNFPPSDMTERRRDINTGYTTDVLNLLAYLMEMAGKDGIFSSADVSRMGIWGHSIGGSIAMRTISVEPNMFRAAVLYGSVSQRYATVLEDTGIYDLFDVNTRFSIHHGVNDDVIRVEQSQELCSQLEQLGKDPECFFYEGQPHTFYRDQSADPLFMERTLEFFDRYVKIVS